MNVEITAIGSLGEGIGTLDDGMKIFIEGALPGENVTVSLSQKKKNYAKGRLVTINTPSNHRVTPICPLFGKCGGCHLMHLAYEEQLKWKQQKVQDALTRIGRQTIQVEQTVPSPNQLHYRNKIQLQVEESKMGMYQKRSHDLIDVPTCYIHNKEGDDIYQWIKSHLPHQENIRHLLLRTSHHLGKTLVVIVTRKKTPLLSFAQHLMQTFPSVVGVVENRNTSQTNTILGKTNSLIAGEDFLMEQLLDKQFKIGPNAFFQVNTRQAEHLIQHVLTLADLKGEETVYDAFTGVGTFALFLADRAKRVIGTECVAEAIACAKENAQLNHILNCEFEVAQASSKKVDLTLLNPPRSGCDPHVLSGIDSDKVIYVSCDPATLARDLSLLSNYTLESATPFDLFPQTVHVETACLLKKIK